MIPQILRDRPLIFWSALLAILGIVALLVPAAWLPVTDQGLQEQTERLTPFSDRVVEVDRKLQNEETVEVDAERRFEMHLFLASRRLARSGDMSQSDMQRAREMLREMHAQLRRERTSAARTSVRNMWLDRIVEEIPRLERSQVDRELATLHRQLEDYLAESGE